MHGEKLIERIRLQEMIVRQGELQAHQERLDPTDYKKEQTG